MNPSFGQVLISFFGRNQNPRPVRQALRLHSYRIATNIGIQMWDVKVMQERFQERLPDIDILRLE